MTIKRSFLVYLNFVKYLNYRLFHEKHSERAAALAYVTLLALIPYLSISFSLLSLIPKFHHFGVAIQTFIFENFVAHSADVLLKYLNEFIKNLHHLSLLHLIFFGGINLILIFNISQAFIKIWDSHPHYRFSIRFIIYIVFLLASPIALGGAVIAGAFLINMPVIYNILNLPHLRMPLSFAFPYVITFLVFTVFNWVLPACKVRLIDALVGGLVTTTMFEIAKFIFTAYLQYFHPYSALYGAFAVIPVFLVWLYVSWTIILVGAIFSHTLNVGLPERFRVTAQ